MLSQANSFTTWKGKEQKQVHIPNYEKSKQINKWNWYFNSLQNITKMLWGREVGEMWNEVEKEKFEKDEMSEMEKKKEKTEKWKISDNRQWKKNLNSIDWPLNGRGSVDQTKR